MVFPMSAPFTILWLAAAWLCTFGVLSVLMHRVLSMWQPLRTKLIDVTFALILTGLMIGVTLLNVEAMLNERRSNEFHQNFQQEKEDARPVFQMLI